MQTYLILTVSSQDKPGVVEAISSSLEASSASWQESRLAHLSGKFVGVIRVRVDKNKQLELESALEDLGRIGINVTIEVEEDLDSKTEAQITAKFVAVGPDRVGIVKEISAALVAKGINVEELDTKLSSMPYSGEPIFEAQGLISVPDKVDMRELMERMDEIANDLGLNLELDHNHSD